MPAESVDAPRDRLEFAATGAAPPQGALAWLLSRQAFWVTFATLLACLVMTFAAPSFATQQNMFNVTRNFAFIGIVALGMTAVIITGGIDLSVGSVMGVAGVITGVVMEAGYPISVGIAAGLGASIAFGLVNGGLIAYLGMPPFVVTLGTLSIGRSLAIVFSNNKQIYDFGPDNDLLLTLGGGTSWGLANPVLVMAVLALVIGFLLRWTRWGRHVYAIGGNEHAANLTGVAVRRIKVSVYVLSATTAGVAAILMVGWLGAVTNGLGLTSELRVIAASVIGGANLMGGVGTAFGSVVGAALIEVIRNSLLLLGVDAFWQGTFVGVFILLAVLFERLRATR
jgi:ribose transport system permease protein